MFERPKPNPSFPEFEAEVLKLWEAGDIFKKSIRGDKEFVFYDGPPFATGRPHYGHLVGGTLKDVVPRYWAMRGYKVERRFGWDTHGLPVEMEIEKSLGLNGPKDVEAYGIEKYNDACRSIVLRYTSEWREVVTRMGRWVDFDNDYKTMDPNFMESVWWVFKALWDKGLIYEGHRIMPYSWRLGTPLSNFEANMDYRSVQDPAVTVSFPVVGREGVCLLAWTTTPWTLPSNMGLCVGPDIDYVEASRVGEDAVYIVAQELAEKVLGEGFVTHKTLKGTALVGISYTPIFDSFADAVSEGAFVVVSDDFVTTTDGTGIVHMAPAYGEDDHRICQHYKLPYRDAVDEAGCFLEMVPLVQGQTVKDADKALMKDLKARGRMFHQSTIEHEYPFCWRSGTPLIYKGISAWFVRVTEIKERMVALNKETNWVPGYVGQKRFGNWLADARDWNISRNRFWGAPIPVWTCDSCDDIEAFGSVADLEAKAGVAVPDLHKHHVDKLTWACDCGGVKTRIPEVLDCWFESGSMPYAQNHYPFENVERVEKNHPADFIAEGLDQTRGWFYTLLVLSTALFDRPAFKNVIVNGLILAEDGQKMSKRLRNYPDPAVVLDKYGADPLRAYLINSPAVRAEPMRFSEDGVRDVVRGVMLPLWNTYSFFAMYASVDGWTPPAAGKASAVSGRSLLDRWVISMMQSAVAEVNQEMEGYRLYNVVPRVLGFIDHLTNWYIRRSRRRFWRSDSDLDKQHAYETLYEMLCTFSRLLAPIMPFMAETLYQRLEVGQREGALESIHLERFPEADNSLVDTALESAMAKTRQIVSLGRNLRERKRIGVRQPLSKITVGLLTPLPEVHRDALAEIIQEELNLKALIWVNTSELVTLSAKANFKTLGRRYGKEMKAAAGAIMALSDVDIKALQEGGTIDILGQAVSIEDVIVNQSNSGDGDLASEGEVTVLLDTTISPSLRREGYIRDLISRVQTVRKDLGLAVEDRISLAIKTDIEQVNLAIEEHKEMLCAEVLAVEFGGDVPDDAPIIYISERPVHVAIRVVSS